MGSRISEEKIEKIKKSVDIVDLISEYIHLKKQGRNYIGLCPFHGENTPSFSVSPEKQLYHCFGCKAGGNSLSFLMQLEGINFIESVKILAEKANIPLPELEVNQQYEGSDKRNVMIEGHELAVKLFHHLLLTTEHGEVGISYLRSRGFTDEIINKFKIGFAPNTWDTLTNFFMKRKYSLPIMEEAGLLAKREFDGKQFDRFRNRIMFPIWDSQGKAIAFGGRIIGEGQPKYLNSPETLLFNKSKTLYGLHLARPAIRKLNQIVLFEGYVDVISSWRAGVENGVATLGTALTEQQAKIIRRNAETVIICYDSDQAGLQATYKASAILQEAGCFVKIARLPEGFDPDDFIQKYGAERFITDVIGASLTLMAFKMEYLRRGKNLQDEGIRLHYIEEVLTEISQLSRSVERDHYLRQLAEEFSLSLDALKQEQYQIYRRQKGKAKNHTSQKIDAQIKRKEFAQKRLLPAFQNAERILLYHMLKNDEIAFKVQEKLGGSFQTEEHDAIAAYLYAYYAEGNRPDYSQFIQKLNDEKLIQITTEVAMMTTNEELSDQELSDYIKLISNYPKWIEIEEKEKQKKEAEKKQNYTLAAQIAMEIIQMKKNLSGG
ncbi:DNA primase [Anaerobacillus sp. MEB173]|uniref:DNA primase n=1 Tax=Anaerobacillus sp. MEB173 TaxID=3383345 RepID=UPI003F8E2F61